MTKEIRIDLDSVTKWRNKNEYRNVPRARCEEFDLEVVGDGRIVQRLAKKLYEEKGQIDATLVVFRGVTPCFTPTPIKTWVLPSGKQPEWLRRG